MTVLNPLLVVPLRPAPAVSSVTLFAGTLATQALLRLFQLNDYLLVFLAEKWDVNFPGRTL